MLRGWISLLAMPGKAQQKRLIRCRRIELALEAGAEIDGANGIHHAAQQISWIQFDPAIRIAVHPNIQHPFYGFSQWVFECQRSMPKVLAFAHSSPVSADLNIGVNREAIHCRVITSGRL